MTETLGSHPDCKTGGGASWWTGGVPDYCYGRQHGAKAVRAVENSLLDPWELCPAPLLTSYCTLLSIRTPMVRGFHVDPGIAREFSDSNDSHQIFCVPMSRQLLSCEIGVFMVVDWSLVMLI